MQAQKRGRGRPRKNQTPNISNTTNSADSRKGTSSKSGRKTKTSKTFSKKVEEPQPKMFLYLQGSDSESESESEENNFTESERRSTRNSSSRTKVSRITSLTANESDDSDYEYEYEYETDTDVDEESNDGNNDGNNDDDDDLVITPIDYSKFNTKDKDVLLLLKHIRRRDAVISRLSEDSERSRRRNIKTGKVNPLHSIKGLSKNNNIEYHCPLANAETCKDFTPCANEYDCWWCDYEFENTPVYIPQMYRDHKFYVFGNFCSYNCALKYNSELKDSKVRARRALLLSMKDKNLGSDVKVKPADRRELLKSKGGPMSVEEFREGFEFYAGSADMDMPPMIPLVHVIKYN
jgi:hypothetical protein